MEIPKRRGKGGQGTRSLAHSRDHKKLPVFRRDTVESYRRNWSRPHLVGQAKRSGLGPDGDRAPLKPLGRECSSQVCTLERRLC